MNKPDDLILLGSMPIPDAHIVKGVLDEYGIPSEIVGETLSTVFAKPGTSWGMTRNFFFRRRTLGHTFQRQLIQDQIIA